MAKSVSAVIIRKEDDRVFVAKRSLNKRYSPGKWETIGGNIEKDETSEEALAREIKEELGVKIKNFQYFKDYQYKDRIFKFFIVELVEKPVPNKEDFIDWGWFSKKEIEEMNFAINCKEKLLDYFKIKLL